MGWAVKDCMMTGTLRLLRAHLDLGEAAKAQKVALVCKCMGSRVGLILQPSCFEVHKQGPPTLKLACQRSTIAKRHAVLCGSSVGFCCMPGDLGRLHAIEDQSERVREMA